MDRVLRFPEVKRLTGLSRTTIWEQERAGTFPRHIQISARAVGWFESHICAWLEALAKGPAEEPARRPNLR
jgi:prophage regulatory protein